MQPTCNGCQLEKEKVCLRKGQRARIRPCWGRDVCMSQLKRCVGIEPPAIVPISVPLCVNIMCRTENDVGNPRRPGF